MTLIDDMNESFCSCVLFYDGSGTIALKGKPAHLRPDKSFHIHDSPGKVYLAGGFPGFTPHADFFLSPTLQLNFDLGSFSEEKLQAIGQAELSRFNASTYRSYTRDPDNRVAVLANQQTLLSDFLETYGGVLQIEPLLLKKHNAEFTTADELQIVKMESGYNLSYTVRTPIDIDKCTYCGLCGPVCEEECLTETLYLDLSKCTYCGKCIQVCSAGAIDLYREEKRSLDIPAIVLLGECGIELPEDRTSIFHAESMNQLFSSLAPLQIDETISCRNAICQYVSRLDAGCEICVNVCPSNAVIKTENGISIQHEHCTECGSCISSCPTGAIQYEVFDDRQFVEWVDIVSIPKNCTVIIGTEKRLHALWWKKNLPEKNNFLFLEFPNIKALTAMHFLLLLSQGAGKVILLENNPFPSTLPVAGEIVLTNSIFSSLFGEQECVEIVSENKLTELLAKNCSSPLNEQYSDHRFDNRREKLGSILRFLLQSSTETIKELPLKNGYVQKTFGTVLCDSEKCTHCGACLNECRINSLTSDEDTLSLNHLSINCVQCGVCVEVCPEDALSLSQGLRLAPDFFIARELTRAETVQCLECGKPFGTRKSFDRVMEKLKSHRVVVSENNFFEYCETCRVVKLFESHQK